jgi:hypothetical protein
VVQKYLDKIYKIINDAIPATFPKDILKYDHFFSGAAVYADQKIFCTYTPVGIAIKLPPKERRELLDLKKGSELRYFPKAPIKKDYIVLGDEICTSSDKLHYWLRMSLDYVSSI